MTSQVVPPIQSDSHHDQLVVRRLDDLRAHPSYVRHKLAVSAAQLSALIRLGEMAFRDPLVISPNSTVLDGYARWELARHQNRSTLICLEYDVSEEEGLLWLLRRHRTLTGLNAFCRVLLALELEPWLQEKARSNQSVGGQQKGWSKLTEADRLNVRAEIAAAAGVSVGNVTKVPQLITAAHPAIREALRHGEISVHRAWLWSKNPPDAQRELLMLYQSERGVKKTIRTLAARHRRKEAPVFPNLADLLHRLSALPSTQLGSVRLNVVKAHGKTVFVTEDLLQALGSCQMNICSSSNP